MMLYALRQRIAHAICPELSVEPPKEFVAVEVQEKPDGPWRPGRVVSGVLHRALPAASEDLFLFGWPGSFRFSVEGRRDAEPKRLEEPRHQARPGHDERTKLEEEVRSPPRSRQPPGQQNRQRVAHAESGLQEHDAIPRHRAGEGSLSSRRTALRQGLAGDLQ